MPIFNKTKKLNAIETDAKELKKAIKILEKRKAAVFIVAYNAEKHIADVLGRIPKELRDRLTEVYIIDDSSKDRTVAAAKNAGAELGYKNFKILKTPFNRGYGGNQKLGYLYAIKRNFDIVILLHGDGQYPPEYLPQIINAFENEKAGAVFASRMIDKTNALKGGMPLYKWFGNQILTIFENFILKSSLSEFHTGYRAYRISALKKIPFRYNTDDFHFDTEIIIQLIATEQNIKEISIPTFYGNEKCNVNGIAYAFNCFKSVIKYRLAKIGLFYEPNFDFKLFEQQAYYFKSAPNSLHQYVLGQDWKPLKHIADLGAGRGNLSAALAEKGNAIASIDIKLPDQAGKAAAKELNLDGNFDQALGYKKFDCVLALDLIEHLANPENGAQKIFKILKPHGVLFASTANIGYFITRLSLLLGQFNYGKRGILDMTHKRLFTIYSMKKLLTANGFKIKKVEYFGPPIIDMVSNNCFWKIIDSLSSKLAKLWPSLFAYNFLVIAERMDDIEEIYQKTFENSAATNDKLF